MPPKPTLSLVDASKLMDALKELKRKGFCEHPKCLRLVERVAWDQDGFLFRYCEDHVREMASLLSKGDGKRLMWVRIRSKKGTPKERLLGAFEDMLFSESVS